MVDNPTAITTQALSSPPPQPKRRGRPPRDQRPVQAEAATHQPQRGDQRLTLPPEPTNADHFNLDERKVPSGMTYQGVRYSVYGQKDNQRMITAQQYHWVAVPRDRHPECATEDPEDKVILKGGLLLMERPSYLDKQAKEREKTKATGQLSNQMERLKLSPTGQENKRMPGFAKVSSNFRPVPGDDE